MQLDKYRSTYKYPIIRTIFWLGVSRLFFESRIPYPSKFKMFLLRMFGCKVGAGVLIKPAVKIKYPWLLEIGKNSWIGERVWIDNLAKVTVGNNCCISQSVYLLTGNHNYKKREFDLFIKPIEIKDSAWVGAKAVVCPGISVGEGAVLTSASVATRDLADFAIYQGNPAVLINKRVIS